MTSIFELALLQADNKAKAENNIKEEIKRSKESLLYEFSKPVHELLIYLHNSVGKTIPDRAHYSKECIPFLYVPYSLPELKDLFSGFVGGINTNIKKIGKIRCKVDDNLNCTIVTENHLPYSPNVDTVFTDFESFMTYVCDIVAKEKLEGEERLAENKKTIVRTK